MKSKRLWGVVIALIIFIGIPMFLTWNFMVGPLLNWRKTMAALIGKGQPDVTATIGAPKYKLTPEQIKSKGIDAPWREMQYVPVPERQVHGDVWLYEEKTEAGWRATYVFFDAAGKVETIEAAAR